MVDVVIPVGPNRRPTLRHALRSIWHHFPAGRVFIVGQVPGWVTNVEPIHVFQDRGRFANQRANIEAVLESDIGDEFVWWDDDHFLLEDREVLPMYDRGPLPDYIELLRPRRPLAALGAYARALAACGELLSRWGHVALAPVHAATWVQKRDLAEVVDRLGDWDRGGIIKVIYSSMVVDRPRVSVEVDPKHTTPDNPIDGWWSVHGSNWDGEPGRWVRSRYWRASPYEAT